MVAPSSPRQLSNAEDRRESVLRAGEQVFAARGIHGTRTADVAKAAGISQAYLFRLFPTKADLSHAVVRRCMEQAYATFSDAAARAKAEDADVLATLGAAYLDLLEDRDALLLQLHAYAAAPEDPRIRDAVRAGFRRLVELVQRESGAAPDAVRGFFAQGMLLNLLAAMDARAIDEPWSRLLLGDC